jgi:hypothetical protein
MLIAAAVSAVPMIAIAAGNTAQLQLTGTIPAVCGFTTLPGSPNLGALTSGSITSIGNFGFTCNLATSGPVTLTIQSLNGGLKRDGGPDTVAYQAAWDVQGNHDVYGDPSGWTTPTSFQLASGLSGIEQSGAYKIKITGPTATLTAGTYRDTITYTITP